MTWGPRPTSRILFAILFLAYVFPTKTKTLFFQNLVQIVKKKKEKKRERVFVLAGLLTNINILLLPSRDVAGGKQTNEQTKKKNTLLRKYIFLSTHPEDEIEDDQGVFDALLRAGQRRHPAVCLSAKHREGITVDTGSLRTNSLVWAAFGSARATTVAMLLRASPRVGGYRDDEGAPSHTPFTVQDLHLKTDKYKLETIIN